MGSARVIVEKFMAVVGTEGNTPGWRLPRPCDAPARSAGYDDGDQIDVAPEMIGLHEGPVRLLGDVAQMRELDVPCEALGH